MQMLQWMSGHTLRDLIQNEDIKKGLGVENIEEKMKENVLRRFGHVQRRGISKLVCKIKVRAKDLKRGRGRPKMTWRTRVEKDMKDLED